ncbi:hypothetical protein F0L68_27900 [Solihabitans fulvus]|uniref:Uncharacterized protein n=1 Tax=Solihabitans fulvus TaxID=1892852 RepID=A0A5B2WZ47_9PSEU|nr:hypothetical protein [Solihabitans fulvus]KAA2256002.1 hypothetical protein F0L68_27900 [Solihabitans fulvus]
MSGERLARVCGMGVRFLPATRQELGRAMLAEAAAIEPGPIRRTWLRSAGWFIGKEIMLVWLRMFAIAFSVLFILWIVYNGIESGFAGTMPEKVSYVGLVVLLTINIILLSRRRRQG